ncbi:hypothetical protein J2X46_004110 [Nocardioides sp. BE266]|uniref:hypothetical protein n=1 Tax=Nocardioides sp. BE266 TaxID=2817725 RepID=UPI002861836C|nr:hypothetical protein [Nocardioides sp. BE266]MDR7255108.1 hypothetical protein [Nocardioides sp. BE266]
MVEATAAAYADERVSRVRDLPESRLELLRELYRLPPDVDRGYLPYRRAASAFMGWQLRRGLLAPPSSATPGSPWWRTLNESLLRDVCEASALAFGRAGRPRTPGAAATLDFIERPTARTWYRGHNTSIVSAYLANEPVAWQEGRVERFFINLVLVRVLLAHALVAEPRLALGRLALLGRPLGDPRLGMTGVFLSLSRILPDDYPLGEDVESYVAAEHGFGHLVDVGVVLPRLEELYEWSADALAMPGLRALLEPGRVVPSYAWDPADAMVWHPSPLLLARVARRVVGPVPGPAPGR